MKLITLIFAICAVFSLRAQISSVDIIDRFQECEGISSSVRIGDRIFTGGRSLDNIKYRPTVVCSDTNGTVIWNSALLGLFNYSNSSIGLLHASADGFLYGSTYSTVGSTVVFKLNPANGALIWTKTLSGIAALKDYGQNIACLADGATSQQVMLKILDAGTGTELSSHFLRSGSLYNFEVDQNLNVYYASFDTIIKRDHLNLNQASWKVKYSAQNMDEFHRIVYDANSGKIIAFGKEDWTNQFKILVVDTLAGNVLNSLTQPGFGSLQVVAIKVKNDDVYFSTTTGTTAADGFRLGKMKLSTGTMTWTFFENLQGDNDNNGIIDIEVDSQDNVYCYGYFNSGFSSGGSNAAMMKVTSTGTLVYTKKYSFNNPAMDTYGRPKRCFLHNNSLYLTAYLQEKNLSGNGNNNYLIKVNPATGDSLFTAPMGGTTINNSSEVKFFVKHPDGGFVAFSRKGQLLNVQRFDNNNSLVWDVNYYKYSNQAYHPVAAAIAPNGQILIGLYTVNVNDLNNLAISGVSSDLMVMMLDANGNQMMEQSFYGSPASVGATSRIVDVLFDGTQFFALMNDNAGVSKQVKISMTGQISYPYPNLVQFSYNADQKKYFADYSTANYMILGNNGSGNAASIKIYAKNDMSIQDLKLCPSYATSVHTFKEVGTTSLLIGGVGTTGEFLFLMNKNTGAIIWEKPAIATGSTIRVKDMELDPTGTYVYVLSDNDFSSVVRRYNVQTGYAMQTNTKAFSTSYGYRPNDLAVNGPTNQVVVGCVRDNYTNSTTEGYYYIMSSNLLQQSDAVFATSSNQSASVNVVHFTPSNGIVLGGNKAQTNGPKKGVIEFSTCVENGTLNVTACNHYLCPINNFNYTASGTYSIFEQTSSLCDSLYTLNLTITQPSTSIDTQMACDSLVWAVNGQTYSVSGQYIDTIQNAAGCDSIITLDLTIIPSLPLVIENSFSMPSDANNCVGEMANTVSGNADFELDIDNGSQVITSSGYSLATGLCAGIHDLKVTDNCGDTLSVSFVIPVDSNYVFTNPFIDSLAQDSLGVTLTNCDIYYGGIDTAYIDSIWAIGNTVNVIWNIVDSNGSNFDTTNYVLNNGTGVYWLQLSVFCPNKSLGEYFTVTEAIYFNNGDIETADLAENEELLFKLHPNPASDQLILSWNGKYKASVELIDVTGAVIKRCEEVSSGDFISVNDLSNAMYYIKWTGEGKTAVKRFIKK